VHKSRYIGVVAKLIAIGVVLWIYPYYFLWVVSSELSDGLGLNASYQPSLLKRTEVSAPPPDANEYLARAQEILDSRGKKCAGRRYWKGDGLLSSEYEVKDLRVESCERRDLSPADRANGVDARQLCNLVGLWRYRESQDWDDLREVFFVEERDGAIALSGLDPDAERCP
jgi:hypothetical protein